MSYPVRKLIFLCALLLSGMFFAACSGQQYGEAAYRSLQQLSCYDQYHSHGRCASASAPE